MTPEEKARADIDHMLVDSGWNVQDKDAVNLSASRGVAVREVSMKRGHGETDYLLFVDSKAIGTLEAKPQGFPLTGAEPQSAKYGTGAPAGVPVWNTPLAFCYESTGTETHFTDNRDPYPCARETFSFYRPETLVELVGQEDTLRARLRTMPSLNEQGLWPAQIKAIKNLEASLSKNHPRALIQMATGSGKTYMAISSIYRLVKFGKARRILFLVDRGNLGRQAYKEFQQYVTPDDGRKFTELYNVQFLRSNKLDPVCKVCITTIQRLYSMLKGEEELPEDADEQSGFDTPESLFKEPLPSANREEIGSKSTTYLRFKGTVTS
jgi:type I restriction enzyme, R subunit